MSVPLVVSGSRCGLEYVPDPAEYRAGTWRSCPEYWIDTVPPKCSGPQPQAGVLARRIDLKRTEDDPCTV